MAEMSLAVVGAGNMGGPLVKGIVSRGVFPPATVTVSDVDRKKVSRVCRRLGTKPAPPGKHLRDKERIVLLCVKPFLVGAVCRELALESSVQLIISIAAGVSSSSIRKHFGRNVSVIRAMPNLAAAVGAAATVIASDTGAAKSDLDIARKIFGSVGKVFEVKEKDMDAVTGLSGSGPAFVAAAIQALADGGTQAGIPGRLALSLAIQTVAGAAAYLATGLEAPAEMIRRVCTPKGTTEAGMREIEKKRMKDALTAAVLAATRRSAELRAEIEKAP